MKLQEAPSQLTLSSHAKINVFLEVHGKRSDGFHELESVMLRTNLQDQLRFRKLTDRTIRIQLDAATPAAFRNSFPLNESNLIVRMADALQVCTGSDLGAEITVLKRIPAEAGLAGGSSNAATTLRALNYLWGLNLSASEQHLIASRLGSDLNFLLSGQRAAVCRGRGEIVEPVPLNRRLWFVAVRPHQGNSTGEVFRQIIVPDQPLTSRAMVASLSGRNHDSVQDYCFNRLTESASKLNPAMADLLHRISTRLCRPAFMSGSGSTCFVCARNRRDAISQQAILRAMTALPTWILEC